MKLTRNVGVWFAAVAALVVLAQGLSAQAPANQQIRFQGRLTNPGGTPIDTSVNVRFRLFTQPTGGTQIWEETQALVPASTGVFTANLGAVQAFTGVDFSQVLYVALAFNADGDMTPRYLLTGTTLAHHAQNASSLGGLPASAYARLSGAIFTGGVTAPSFTGSLVGNADTATTATSFSGNLAGNVTGPMNSTVVASVGGVTAANVATGANLANASTNLNTANQIVRRDGSGNFSAGSITATTFIGALNGNAATATTAGSAATATSAASFTGSLGGDVTGTQSATQVVNIGGQSATNVASGAIAANAATNANTNNAIVRRDASGNFAAGTITAALNGNASTATTANQLLGSTWAAPQAIGATTPAAGTFTGLSSSSLTTSGLASFGNATVGGSLGAVGTATLGNDAATPSRGLLALHDNTASNVFTSTLRTTGALTQNRTVDLPDASGVVVLDTTISGFFSGNFVAVNGTSIMTGNLNMGGQDISNVDSVSAATFFGGGAGITGVNASQLAGQAGAFYVDRANHTGNTPSASLSGALPALNGAALTNLTGANVTGTVAAATNSAQLNGQSPAFYLDRVNHTGNTPSASLSGALPALNGAALTNLTGANVTGTVASATNAAQLNAQLPAFYLSRTNHTGNTPSASLSGPLPALDGAALTNLSGANVTGPVAAATLAANSTLFAGDNPAFYLARANHTGILPGAALSGVYANEVTLTNSLNAFTGDGTGLTGVNAVALNGENGNFYRDRANHFGATPAASLVGLLPALDGSQLTNLTAANITGTVAAATNALNLGGNAPSFYLDASNIGAGTLMDARLSSNVAMRNTSNTFAGDITAAGRGAFTAPLEVNPVGPSFRAHSFEAAVNGNGTTPTSSLQARIVGTTAGASEVTGAWLESISDGGITQGVFGQASYSGGVGGGTAIGLDGRARTFGTGPHGFLAIGTAGRADDAQLGSNVGVHAWARDGGKTAGLFAVANATEAEQQAFDATLPAGITASILGFNNAAGPNAYGLHVTGANNRIVGDLTVTGTLNASVTGTADNANNLAGNAPAFYLDRTNHTGNTPSASLTGALPALDGAALTNLSGANVTGSVASATLAADATLFGANNPAFYLDRANHTGSTPSASLSGALPALDGAALTNLSGANVTGAVPQALSATTAATATNALALGGNAPAFYLDRGNHTGSTPSASLTGALPALDGAALTNLTGANVTGAVPQALAATTAANAANLGGQPASAYALLSGAAFTGNLSTTGGLNSFTATQGGGGGYTGHSFAGSVNGAVTGTRAAGLHVNMSGTNTSTGGTPEDVAAAWFETTSDGNQTQGLMGHATFNGTAAAGNFAVGVAGRAANLGTGGIFAVGVSGSVIENQDAGGNVGVHAYALNTGTNGTHAGLAAFANADIPEQSTFQTGLALAGFGSAAVIGHNPVSGSGHYGLYIGAANNRIDGNLTVTGTLDAATITGTVGNANNLNNQPGTFYLDRNNHSGNTPSASLSGNLPALDGSALTNLTAANITGTLTYGQLNLTGSIVGADLSPTIGFTTSGTIQAGTLRAFSMEPDILNVGNNLGFAGSIAVRDFGGTVNAQIFGATGNTQFNGNMVNQGTGSFGGNLDALHVFSPSAEHGTLLVTGAATINGGASVLGTTSINASGTAATTIGNTSPGSAVNVFAGGAAAITMAGNTVINGNSSTDGTSIGNTGNGGAIELNTNAAPLSLNTVTGVISLNAPANGIQLNGNVVFPNTATISGPVTFQGAIAGSTGSFSGLATFNGGADAQVSGTTAAIRGGTSNVSGTGLLGETTNGGVGVQGNATGGIAVSGFATLGFGIAGHSNGGTAGAFSTDGGVGVSVFSSAGTNPLIQGNHNGTGDLLDLQRLSVSQFRVDPQGNVTAAGGLTAPGPVAFANASGPLLGLDIAAGGGQIRLHDDTAANNRVGIITLAPSLSQTQIWTFPDQSGDVALAGNVLALSGGTMTGSVNMGLNNITNAANGEFTFLSARSLVAVGSSGVSAGQLVVQAINGANTVQLDGATGNATLSGVVTAASVNVGSASGPQILSGSGAPSADAPIGSLYLRTDAVGTNGTALYSKAVAGAGAGNWRNVTGS